MQSYEILKVDSSNREIVNAFIVQHWYDIRMVIRGKIIDLSESDGYCIIENQRVIGVITYCIEGGECEITLLHSLLENQGIGTRLVQAVLEAAQTAGAGKVKVITTNDNIRAILFYQRKGFDMAVLYHNSMDKVREIKRGVPLIGENGILLKHEIEFVKTLG